MQLPIPNAVIAFGSSYSLLEMARHIVATDHRYNRTADGARSGARLVAALQNAKAGAADVQEQDLRLFAEVVEQPGRGWGAHVVLHEVPDPRTGNARKLERKAHASAVTYLPLIDAVVDAAKGLPSLTAGSIT